MTEFNLAFQHYITTFHKNRVILVMMLDSPSTRLAANDGERVDLDMESLRQYIRQYTYIDYKARNWMDRMMYCLPINGMLRGNNPGLGDPRTRDEEDASNSTEPLLSSEATTN